MAVQTTDEPLRTEIFETDWWTVRLPEGYEAENTRGFIVMRTAGLPGELHLECMRKAIGATNRDDLRDHCSGAGVACEIGEYRGFFAVGEMIDRWALSRRGSNKLILVRFCKDEAGAEATAEVRAVLRGVRLK